MKTLLAFLLVCLMAMTVSAQTNSTPRHHKKKDTNAAPDAPPAPDPNLDLASQVKGFQKAFVPTDPWRILNEKTNFAKGTEWVQFEGTVVSVSAAGMVLQGWFDEPLAYLLPHHSLANTRFLVSGYPRPVSIGRVLSRNDRLVAYKSEMKEGLPTLEYGTVWVPELTEEQKAQAAQAKSKTQSKVLAFHQELADKGDAYGEYKMGMHYLAGDGVDKDVAKARDWLGKSAAQGNQDAAAELAKLPASP